MFSTTFPWVSLESNGYGFILKRATFVDHKYGDEIITNDDNFSSWNRIVYQFEVNFWVNPVNIRKCLNQLI